MKSVLIGFASLAALVVAAGCQPSPNKVMGKATLNGEPVEFGVVVAYDEQGQQVGIADLTEEGYILEGVPSGKLTIAVMAHRPDGNPAREVRGVPPMPPTASPKAKETLEKNLSPEAKAALAKVKPLPLKYSSYKGSGLEVTVEAGKSVTYNLEMTGKGVIPKVKVPRLGGPPGGPPPPPPPPRPGGPSRPPR